MKTFLFCLGVLQGIVLLGLSGSGCAAEDRSTLILSISELSGDIHTLRLVTTMAGTQTINEYQAAPTIGLRLPQEASGQVDLLLSGLGDGGCLVATGQASVQLSGEQQITVSVKLTQCSSGATCCSQICKRSAAPQSGEPVAWVPDYDGQKIQVRIGEEPNTRSVTLQLEACNPNSVAVSDEKLYVVCNKASGNPDKILVYGAAAIRSAPACSTLTSAPLITITSAQFSFLMGMAFDGQKNLWVASYGSDSVLRLSAASLATPSPIVDLSLINSPNQPVGLAFDTDGSLWVTGQYMGGILLNIVPAQLAAGGDVPWRYCVFAAPGCPVQTNRFNAVEGVALFKGKVWVSNNGGNQPGRELVSLRVNPGTPGTLVVDGVFGSRDNATSPFVCPGGLFSTAAHLWVNDQGLGKTDTTCGATDPGSAVGGVLRFNAGLLDAQSTDPNQIVRFTNITGRPGFGGLFVEVR